jgi:hypothetical protein
MKRLASVEVSDHCFTILKCSSWRPTVTGSDADYATLTKWTDAISRWSDHYHLPIFYGEFGCTHIQNVTTGRDKWYVFALQRVQLIIEPLRVGGCTARIKPNSCQQR